ncbi:MAG: hypothetical protein RR768_03385 [Clostridium sp.]
MIRIEKEEIPQIDLLTPLYADYYAGPYEVEHWEEENHDINCADSLDGTDLVQYEDLIKAMVEKENLMGGSGKPCNLMDYFGGSPSIKEKVISAIVSVKNVDDILYGCTTLQLREFLETEEIEELCEYITGQYADGWGEVFEQRDIIIDCGKLNVHFWQERYFEVFEKPPNQTAIVYREAQPPKQQLLGHDGNIFTIMGTAIRLLRASGMEEKVSEMVARVDNSKDYHHALHIISEYVETKLSEPKEKKPKKLRKGDDCR